MVLGTGCSSRPKLQVDQVRDEQGHLLREESFYIAPGGEHVKHGRQLHYWPNGSRAAEAWFEHGIWQGRQTQWWPSGTRLEEGNITAGRREGLWIGWHDNGAKSWETVYQDDRICGMKRTWYKIGRLRSEAQYSNGQLCSIKTWYQSGGEMTYGMFKAGHADGIWRYRAEDGTLLAEGTYCEGEPCDGVLLTFAEQIGHTASSPPRRFVEYRSGQKLRELTIPVPQEMLDSW